MSEASAVRQRTDLHNAAVDLRSAEEGRCGAVHLASGRVCTRPARHSGSCEFQPRPAGSGPAVGQGPETPGGVIGRR